MNIDPIKEIMNNLENKGHKDEFLKEQEDLEKEIWQCLKSTNTLVKEEPFFLFLRRFNSYTPAIPPRPRIALTGKASKDMKEGFERFKDLVRFVSPNHRVFTDVKGGGCFLSWQGKGIVIDPGYDFIENMYSEDLSIGDINAIIITHAHNDHYIDLDPILTLAYQYNKLSQAYNSIFVEDWEDAIRQLKELLDFYPYGFAYDAYVYCRHKLGKPLEGDIDETKMKKTLLEFEEKLEKEIMPELKTRYRKKAIKLFFTKSAENTLKELVTFIDSTGARKCIGDADGPYPVTNINKELQIDLNVLDVKETETQHNDFKRVRGKGLIFTLGWPDSLWLNSFKIGITSDTAWFDKDDQKL